MLSARAFAFGITGFFALAAIMTVPTGALSQNCPWYCNNIDIGTACTTDPGEGASGPFADCRTATLQGEICGPDFTSFGGDDFCTACVIMENCGSVAAAAAISPSGTYMLETGVVLTAVDMSFRSPCGNFIVAYHADAKTAASPSVIRL